MSIVHLLPGIIAAEMFAASLVYIANGDWRSATYWFCAGAMNVVVTWR